MQKSFGVRRIRSSNCRSDHFFTISSTAIGLLVLLFLMDLSEVVLSKSTLREVDKAAVIIPNQEEGVSGPAPSLFLHRIKRSNARSGRRHWCYSSPCGAEFYECPENCHYGYRPCTKARMETVCCCGV